MFKLDMGMGVIFTFVPYSVSPFELPFGLKTLMQFLNGENIVNFSNLAYTVVLILLYGSFIVQMCMNFYFKITLKESHHTILKISYYPTCNFMLLLCLL